MQKEPNNNHLPPQQGLVISSFGSSVAVERQDGQVFQCHLRRNQETPVVGDHVYWESEHGETGVITGILPRRSALLRGDARGKTKPIVANLDIIVIVMVPPPIFSEYLIDRYLIAAELLNIRPIIVVNKSDLLSDQPAKADELTKRLEIYSRIPYTTLLSSAILPNGLAALSAQLKGQQAVLVGPSGAGKSSIIASLTQTAIRVGDVSPKGVGKHTTTATRLYHLPEGGCLIDSPGVREFNLWSVTPPDILKGFKEFQQVATHCKFRNCLHIKEPGCAVQKAVEDGKISPERYATYQTLIQETAKFSHNKKF